MESMPLERQEFLCPWILRDSVTPDVGAIPVILGVLEHLGFGSLQYATVSRENLGLWHLTKSCNTKKKLNPQEL